MKGNSWQVGSEQGASENGFDQVCSYLLQSHDTATASAMMTMVTVMMVRVNDNHGDVVADEEGDEGAAEAGADVVVHFRKVATSDSGLLTFERFCAGLKICLLRNQKVCKPLKKLYS